MNTFRKKLLFIGASWVIWPGSNLFAEEPETYTYSNFQLHEKALTLELEIHPHLLQQARVLRDRDGDGQMSQLEFDESKAAIVHYVQQKLSVLLNERMLHADSAAITYRFEDSSPSPHRIYVTCRYALLLKPHQLVLRNEMFQELTERSRNYGVLSDGRKNADFAFRSRMDKVSSPVQVEFFATGEWHLVERNTSGMSPAVYWGIAGCSGLLILAVAAWIRKNANRRTGRHKRKPRSPSISAAREHLQYEQV